MANPVLFAVDEDADALSAVERELVDRYEKSYRIVCASSAQAATAQLSALAEVGADVALALAAPTLKGTTGSELLGDLRNLHPHAQRALMIDWGEWGDSRTADQIFRAMARRQIEYYVIRPSGTPDELFHQSISTFLLEWASARRVSPHTVHVVGEAWAGRAFDLRQALGRCAVPHAFVLADSPAGREFVARVEDGAALPLVAFPNGTILPNPSDQELASAAGWDVDPEHREFDVLIVGAGPAGLSAAVYGASEGLRTAVVDSGGIGGQATSSSLIRNYLGFQRGVSGRHLAQSAYEQAWVFGAKFAFMHYAIALRREGERLQVSLSDGSEMRARAVVLATGATYRRLGIDAIEDLVGAGVFYGDSTTEAPGVAGQDVYVVGGANSAGQAAMHLAEFASRVTLVIRGESLDAGMSHYLVRQIEDAANIVVRVRTEVVGGKGDSRLESLVLRDRDDGRAETVRADALFVMIGSVPNTDWLPDELARDAGGFIRTGASFPDDGSWPLARGQLALETSIPGVFAAGDARHGSLGRVAAAVGEGSAAIRLVHELFEAEASQLPVSR